jgi:hypothetical protein
VTSSGVCGPIQNSGGSSGLSICGLIPELKSQDWMKSNEYKQSQKLSLGSL